MFVRRTPDLGFPDEIGYFLRPEGEEMLALFLHYSL